MKSNTSNQPSSGVDWPLISCGRFRDVVNALQHGLVVEDFLPVRLKESALGFLDGFERPVRKSSSLKKLEHDSQFHFKMAEQEIARRSFRNPEFHSLVHRLAHNGQAGAEYCFREHGFENCHLVRSATVRVQNRSINSTRHRLSQCILFFRPLHEAADDVLLCVHAAEKVTLCLRLRLAAEYGRVTRVRDEVD